MIIKLYWPVLQCKFCKVLLVNNFNSGFHKWKLHRLYRHIYPVGGRTEKVFDVTKEFHALLLKLFASAMAVIFVVNWRALSAPLLPASRGSEGTGSCPLVPVCLMLKFYFTNTYIENNNILKIEQPNMSQTTKAAQQKLFTTIFHYRNF